MTDFRGFRQFGYIGGAGMVLSWGAAFVLMPPLIARLESQQNTARPVAFRPQTIRPPFASAASSTSTREDRGRCP